MLLSTIPFSTCRAFKVPVLLIQGYHLKILAAPKCMYKKNCKGTVFNNSSVKKQMHVFQKLDTGNHSGWIIQLFPVHAVQVTCLWAGGVTEYSSSHNFLCLLTAKWHSSFARGSLVFKFYWRLSETHIKELLSFFRIFYPVAFQPNYFIMKLRCLCPWTEYL